MAVTRIDYRDNDGIMRRVLVPTSGEAEPSEGVPVSLPVDYLYEHMPIEFRQRLMEALYTNGFIEPDDYLKAGAAERIRAAWLSVIKRDVLDIQQYAKEYKNGKR